MRHTERWFSSGKTIGERAEKRDWHNRVIWTGRTRKSGKKEERTAEVSHRKQKSEDRERGGTREERDFRVDTEQHGKDLFFLF